MKTKFYLSIFWILILSTSGLAQSKPVRVFITAGQSNTDGRIRNTLLPEEIKALSTDSNYLNGAYRFAKISQNDKTGQFVPYWPKGRLTEGLWTYDAVTYYRLEQVLKEDFYIVKWAVGGTSIASQQGNPKGRYWSADSAWLQSTQSVENGGNSLLLSFTDAIDAAIDQTLSKLEQGYNIDAFLWHQGESDFKRGGQYYTNLKTLIEYVRRHLTHKTGKDYSKLPFVFGNIPKSNKDFDPLVESAMQRIAEEDQHAFLIDLSDSDLQNDRLHFTTNTATYFGVRVFKLLDRILGLSPSGFRVANYRDDKASAISYTFDDGLKEHYTMVLPWFNSFGFKGTFWINGNKVNANSAQMRDTTRVTWDELRQMARHGHEISNHGWDHRNFGRFSLEEIAHDISRNDSVLFAEIGKWPRTFCYPNNTKTSEGLVIANRGRVGTRLLQRSIGSKATDQHLADWVEQLIANNEWGVGMTHGITYGYDHFINPVIFQKHLQRVKAKEDKIWVGTFEEVSAYIKARKDITYDIVEEKRGYVIRLSSTLDRTLFDGELTGVIEDADQKKIIIRQGGGKLKTRIVSDKILFNFSPHGGDIYVDIR